MLNSDTGSSQEGVKSEIVIFRNIGCHFEWHWSEGPWMFPDNSDGLLTFIRLHPVTHFVKCLKIKYVSKEHVCTIPRLHLELFRDRKLYRPGGKLRNLNNCWMDHHHHYLLCLFLWFPELATGSVLGGKNWILSLWFARQYGSKSVSSDFKCKKPLNF